MHKFAALAALLAALPLSGQDAIRWFGSFPEAIAEAKRTGKPIFLEFRCEA